MPAASARGQPGRCRCDNNAARPMSGTHRAKSAKAGAAAAAMAGRLCQSPVQLFFQHDGDFGRGSYLSFNS